MDVNTINERGMDSFAQLLDAYWKQATECGIAPDAAIPYADEEVYREHRTGNLRMYAYMNRISYLVRPYMRDVSYALALFDSDGCLLKLIGTEALLDRLREDGIEKGAIWKCETIGPNAVTVGLQERTSIASGGAQNYHKTLWNYGLYFSPVTLQESLEASQEVLYGGVALISPEPQLRMERLAMAVSMANHIILIWAQSKQLYSLLYESIGYALMTCNINMYNQKAVTFYHSQNIFEVLGVPEADIYIKPTAEFIDPLPRNETFWEIIAELRRVHELEMTLSIQGKEVDCIVTSEPFYQPSLNIRSIHFYITTAKKTSAHIAKRIGNGASFTFENIVGESPQIKSAVRKARMLSGSYANVMLLGESGTGKDLFAQAIHNASGRSDKPFIAINCGAIPRELIASELFGYEGGAFTGAKRQGNIGKFELANGGTIFLDEIGEMPLDLQATLLRVVEQKQFMRLGSNRLIDVDVKIISATNVDIFSMIEEKRFRADLYYRLSTMHLDIPPLRERGNDIVILADYFIHRLSERIGKKEIMSLSDEAKKLLLEFSWHGNVRELQNLIDCIVQLYDERVITVEHIRENLQWRYTAAERCGETPAQPEVRKRTKNRALTEAELRQALDECDGNRSQAARLLGIDRRALYRNMERLNLK